MKFILWLFNFKNIFYFPLVLMTVLYLVPSIIGIAAFHDYPSFLFLGCLLLAFVTFIFSFAILSLKEFQKLFQPIRTNFLISSQFQYIIIFYGYLVFTCYVFFTTPQLPLIASLLGKSVTSIALDRESLYHLRTGYEVIIPYLNVIFTTLLMPYLIIDLFLKQSRKRFFVLLVFLFCLALTLQKSASMVVLLPLIILMVNKVNESKVHRLMRKYKRRIVAIFILVLALIMTASFFSRLGHVEHKAFSRQNREFYFTSSNPVSFIANRIFWTPYITGYDTLSYFEARLNGNYLYGRGSLLIDAFTGMEKINVDQQVFKYEYGWGAKGHSNAAYFIGAYLDFGFLGVVLYTFFIALLCKVIFYSHNKIVKLLFYYSLLIFMTGSFWGVIFSNGVLFLIIIAVFSGHKRVIMTIKKGGE